MNSNRLNQLPKFSYNMKNINWMSRNFFRGRISVAAGCREVVIIGTSTPLGSAAFASTSATLLSGILVDRPGAVLQSVSEGGGTRDLKKWMTKVNLRL